MAFHSSSAEILICRLCPWFLTLPWQPKFFSKAGQKSTFLHNSRFFPLFFIKLQNFVNVYIPQTFRPDGGSYNVTNIIWRHNQQKWCHLVGKAQGYPCKFISVCLNTIKTQRRDSIHPHGVTMSLLVRRRVKKVVSSPLGERCKNLSYLFHFNVVGVFLIVYFCFYIILFVSIFVRVKDFVDRIFEVLKSC